MRGEWRDILQLSLELIELQLESVRLGVAFNFRMSAVLAWIYLYLYSNMPREARSGAENSLTEWPTETNFAGHCMS